MVEETINSMIDSKYRDRFKVISYGFKTELRDNGGCLITGKDLVLRYLYEGKFMKEDLQKKYDDEIIRKKYRV